MSAADRAANPSSATRRQWLLAGAALVVRPAAGTPQELAAAIQAFTGGAAPRAGRVTLDVSPLVENGNTVPMTVTVDSPMTAADHVVAIAVFNERNPQREVANFFIGPRAGRAVVASRIRLATSQQLVAVALMSDGSHWSHTIDVVVTLAACIE
ncbi:MAG: sulfur oxidation protein SoxY [Methylibium sp. NZG]|nr:MAG: sulfur oxidation protein SoxY [Methylibium sp. NZG]